jgi:NAD(P)-dependent dehydrogenase (short-subunit alcohol dehydrogenase family)
MADEPNYLEKLFGLKGRVAVVTGGMGQLGAQYAGALTRAGAQVAIYDLKKEPKAELRELAQRDAARFFAVDITDRQSLEKATDELEAAWGAPGILINNAAIDFPPRPSDDKLEAESVAQWEKVLQVNLTGVFLCCQVIGERMAKAGGGSIINIASTYGLVSPDQRIYAAPGNKRRFIKPAVYGVSKAGVLNLTRYLATSWAGRGIRVNALTLGGVFNRQEEWFVANYSQRTPLGRMAREDEYNGAILFLASEASSYMTGANLVIDGGWTAW